MTFTHTNIAALKTPLQSRCDCCGKLISTSLSRVAPEASRKAHEDKLSSHICK